MTETRQIVRMATQPGAVLVTLVRVEGSSYRRPGARLLASGGMSAGTISGGCLEAEVVRRAPWLVRDGAALETYAMQFNDTAEIPFGLGCGGTVELLFEPVGTPEGTALLAALDAGFGGTSARVVTFLPGDGKPLRRVIFSCTDEVIFASAGLDERRIECARGLEPGKAYAGRFVEAVDPPQRLVVCGAGDDARPLVTFAAQLGWSVTVADGRRQLLGRERFPEATALIDLHADPDGLALEPQDAVVLMTHSYEQDRELLVKVLPAGPRYLGLLGSRHRSSLLMAEAAVQLGLSIGWIGERVCAPVGLDLGGDGPAAIALAIVAEIQGVCNGRPAVSRRLDVDEIARHLEEGGSSRYLQAQCALSVGL